jgi:hypothetical protein
MNVTYTLTTSNTASGPFNISGTTSGGAINGVLIENGVTKEQLVTNIKEWIKIDNEIAQLKSEIKDRNNKKKNLTENLVVTMKKNQIDCFDINGGALVYKQNKLFG